jgi:hypothetical protein
MTITITNSSFNTTKFISIAHGSQLPTIILHGTEVTAQIGIEQRDDPLSGPPLGHPESARAALWKR